MGFFNRNYDEIVSDAIQRLSQNTNITQLSPGSKARFFVESFAVEQADQYRIFDQNMMQSFIRFADSRFLDYFGDMLNLTRRESSIAEDTGQNFMFFVSTGTFGDINGGNDFTIPSNTLVSTVPYPMDTITPGIEQQAKISYQTVNDVVCTASESFVYVPVKALVEGSKQDVPANVLNQHEFTNYSLSSRNLLKCTNKYSISSGEDRETDEAYRYRLSQVFRAKEMANLAAIRLAALSVPGVSNIKEILCEQGPGTYSLYVKSVTPTTSPKLLTEVAINVNNVTAYGIRPFILAANPIGLEFVVGTYWSPRATAAQKTEGYANMRNALEKQLNELDIGESLLFSDVIDTLLFAAPLVQSIGISKQNKFEEIYAYRSSPNGGSPIRTLIYGDEIKPLYNERIILETSGRNRGIQFLGR